jgi:hypothetical protein
LGFVKLKDLHEAFQSKLEELESKKSVSINAKNITIIALAKSSTTLIVAHEGTVQFFNFQALIEKVNVL